MRLSWRTCVGVGWSLCFASAAAAQQPLTWVDVRDRFRATNPAVQAGRIGVDESKAAETTAYLRPNPQWSLTLDQIGDTESGNAFSAANLLTTFSYLHEREGKRELRRDSAHGVTDLTLSVRYKGMEVLPESLARGDLREMYKQQQYRLFLDRLIPEVPSASAEGNRP